MPRIVPARGAWSLALLAWSLAGCAHPPPAAAGSAGDRQEIGARIADIRGAILAKSAAGIVRHATAGYAFTGADGVAFDRDGFVRRTETLFGRVVAIESLETNVDTIMFSSPGTADVEITQTMVRSERAADTGVVTRLWLRYRERHAWVRTGEGWKVDRVQFIGTPERKVLPPP